MQPKLAAALNIFVSYAHEDEALRQELENHLAALKLITPFEVWHDRKIAPGSDWNRDIESHFDSAHIILLLVSSDFLASQFCNEIEMPRALKRREAGHTTVIPIIVREVAWEDTPLRGVQASPKDGKPVTSWSNRDAAWKDVVEAIRAAILRIIQGPPAEQWSAGDSLKEGVQALAQLMTAAEVKEAVVESRTEFEVSRSQIDVMGDYKDIHDQLHFLKLNCYDCIVQEAARFPDDDLARENLTRYLDDAYRIAGKIDEIAGRKSAVEVGARRIHGKLTQALQSLEEAIEKSENRKLQDAVAALSRLLSRDPALINVQLNAAAKALRLSELSNAMTRTCKKAEGLNLDEQQTARFRDGVAALNALSAGLSSLIKEHDRWQVVEGDLILIENSKDHVMAELRLSWPSLQPEVRSLCTPQEEKWAQDLLATGEKLDGALKKEDPASTMRFFRQYRRRAALRFYSVDEKLKRQCDQLRKVGEPLDLVLRMIK